MVSSNIHAQKVDTKCPDKLPIYLVQGVWSFLHPKISQNPEKIESWTGHHLKILSPILATPKKWQSPELATPKLTRVGDSAIFGGGQSWTYVISDCGQFGGGKKDQTPCRTKIILNQQIWVISSHGEPLSKTSEVVTT